MVRVPVNRIIPFSSVDGPGSRTAVFLQGCNLDCRYCHNPETRNLCTDCGGCLIKCRTGALYRDSSGTVSYDYKRCVFCDACIQTCRNGSSPRIRMMDADEVYKEIAVQIPFIRGVTVSGGECMLYPDFLTELFARCRAEGLHTLIDSNGTVDFSQYPKLLEVTDGVMLDVKAFDKEQHRTVTGHDNEQILANAVFLAERGKISEVRTVVVPGLFDAEDTVRRTAALLSRTVPEQTLGGTICYKLITYREAGVRRKYRCYRPPVKEQMEYLAELARTEGIKRVVIV